MKRPPAPHHWYQIEGRLSPWWHFENSRARGEQELVQGRGLVTGYTSECVQCGIVRVYVRFVDSEGCAREVPMYGFNFDALSPMSTPRCEPLVRPALADSIDVAEDPADDLQSGAAA